MERKLEAITGLTEELLCASRNPDCLRVLSAVRPSSGPARKDIWGADKGKWLKESDSPLISS